MSGNEHQLFFIGGGDQLALMNLISLWTKPVLLFRGLQTNTLGREERNENNHIDFGIYRSLDHVEHASHVTALLPGL